MRGDPQHKDSGGGHRVHGTKENASFQIIVLVGQMSLLFPGLFDRDVDVPRTLFA
jgi:hypothetical protein